MAAVTTLGHTVEIAVESALGTPGSYGNLRTSGAVEVLRDTKKSVELSTIFANPTKAPENPITYEMYSEGELTVPLHIRAGDAFSTKPPIAKILESGGCAVLETTYRALDGFTSEVAFSAAGDLFGSTIMAGAVMELDGPIYRPFLCASYSGSAAYNVTPTFGLDGPHFAAAAATPANNDVFKSWVIQPRVGPVSSSKTLAFRMVDRMIHTADNWATTKTGCAMSEPGDLVFEFGKPVAFSPKFHVGKTADSNVAIAAETFCDSTKPLMIGGNYFEVALAGSSTSSIASSGNFVSIEKAVVKLGIKTIPLIGDGGTGTLNGLQGYFADYSPATATLTIVAAKSWFDDFMGATFASKYLHIAQCSTAATDPVLGFYMPKCRLQASPVITGEANSYYKMDLTFVSDSPGYNSETGYGTYGQSPWTIVMGLPTNA